MKRDRPRAPGSRRSRRHADRGPAPAGPSARGCSSRSPCPSLRPRSRRAPLPERRSSWIQHGQQRRQMRRGQQHRDRHAGAVRQRDVDPGIIGFPRRPLRWLRQGTFHHQRHDPPASLRHAKRPAAILAPPDRERATTAKSHIAAQLPSPADNCAGSPPRSGSCPRPTNADDGQLRRPRRSRWVKQMKRMP